MTESDRKASDIVSDYVSLLRRPVIVPPIAASFLSDVLPVRNARPCAVLLSPHPDDECLTGALPLRLRQEQGWQVINIALTLGSNPERRSARKAELAKACAVLGFDCALPVADSFSAVNEAARTNDQAAWQEKTARLAAIVSQLQPQAIFMPHAKDAHAAHTGTHHLGMDALALLPTDFTCAVFQTEYWQPNEAPNLMIGIGEKDVAVLMSALACHAGENARNAFDLRFPAYLIDTVRRGAERVGGAGKAAPAIDFAMLYNYGIWKNGKFIASALSRLIAAQSSLDDILS